MTIHTVTIRRMFTLVAVGILALGAAACSSDSPTGQDGAAFNDDDVMFAQMMIPHHEQAIEMADIALDPTVGAGDSVKDLARRIKDAQDPEIQTMTNLLTAWGKPTTMPADMDHSEMMGGMLALEELDELGTLRGAQFDARWIEAMIAHHEGAIAMAEDVLSKGVHPDMLALAREVIDAQRVEIDEMKTLQ